MSTMVRTLIGAARTGSLLVPIGLYDTRLKILQHTRVVVKVAPLSLLKIFLSSRFVLVRAIAADSQIHRTLLALAQDRVERCVTVRPIHQHCSHQVAKRFT